jgi:hypothetical protein
MGTTVPRGEPQKASTFVASRRFAATSNGRDRPPNLCQQFACAVRLTPTVYVTPIDLVCLNGDNPDDIINVLSALAVMSPSQLRYDDIFYAGDESVDTKKSGRQLAAKPFLIVRIVTQPK